MWPVASRLPLSGALARLVGDHASSAAWLYVVTLLRLHPWRVAGALALMAGVGLTQGIGLLLLVPLLQAAGIEVQYGGVGRVSAAITFVFASLGVPPTLLAALLVYVVLIGAHALLARWQSVLSTTISQQVAARLRRRLYGAVANMQWRVFSRHRASDFAHALTMEPDRVAEGTEYLLGLVANTLIVLVYVALALRLSPVVTAITVVCAAGIWVLFRRRV